VGTAQVATYTTNTLTAGNHTITAAYGGALLFTTSTGTLSGLVVAADGTSTQVSSTSPTSTYGQTLTFTALVTQASPGGITPTGSVTFTYNSTVLGTGTLNSLGIATFTTASLPASATAYTITASYTPADANFTASDSSGTPYLQTENPATLTVTASNQVRVYGDLNPTLTVQYSGFVNGDTLATSGVTGAPSLSTAATPTSPVAGSPYSITASAGTLSANNYTFNFVNGLLTVNPATLLVTANSASRQYGSANPALTATFSGFKNGETLATSGVTGSPSLTTPATAMSPVTGSPYSIVASAGTLAASNYTFNFASGQLTLTPAPLTISTDPKVKVYGAPLPALTLSYSGFVNGDTAASLISPPAASTIATPTSALGVYLITASGASSPNYAISYQAGTIAVTTAYTANAFIAPMGTSVSGQPATFYVYVTPFVAGVLVPTGTVTFYSDGVRIGSAPVDARGIATFVTSSLPVGSHSMLAIYGGDSGFGPCAFARTTQTVNKAATQTFLTSQAVYGPTGQPTGLWIYAVVTNLPPGGGPIGGSATFYVNGQTYTSSAVVHGVASMYVKASYALNKSFSARYSGDTNHTGGTSYTITYGKNSISSTSRSLTSLSKRGL
jgi:hypothetical protein